MKTLAILSQKGGVSKTTLATCLAVAAENDGKRTALFDLDPQATASFWNDIREADTPAVASIQAVRLPVMLNAAREAGTDLAIIDGAAVARDVTFAAAKVADIHRTEGGVQFRRRLDRVVNLRPRWRREG